jgi:predicted nucleic acid-binding protein
MRNIVIADSGFLIALFDAGDALHGSAKESLKALDRHGGVWLPDKS